MEKKVFMVMVAIEATDKQEAEEKAKSFTNFSKIAGLQFIEKCYHKLINTNKFMIEQYFGAKMEK